MTEKVNLTQAAELLAELTNKPRLKGDILGIIRAGVAGKIPVYWFNDLQISTRISNFKGDLPTTYWDGPEKIKKIKFLNDPNQLTSTSLRELIVSESTTVMDFELSDYDFDILAKMQGSIVDQDGNLVVYRHPATNSGTVTISRDQLFIFESDLRGYAATLAPTASTYGNSSVDIDHPIADTPNVTGIRSPLRWTEERKAEVFAYKAKHGRQATAKFYNVTPPRIDQVLADFKPQNSANNPFRM